MVVQIVQVTQRELEEIHELERDVKEKQKRIDALKQGVKVLLIHKMPVELGRFDAFLIKRISRPVPWKQACIDNLGVDFVETFRKKYPPQVRFDVGVEEHAVLPLWKGGANSTSPEVI